MIRSADLKVNIGVCLLYGEYSIVNMEMNEFEYVQSKKKKNY